MGTYVALDPPLQDDSTDSAAFVRSKSLQLDGGNVSTQQYGSMIKNEENGDPRDSADKQQDIPNHPWPYLREIFEIVGIKNDSWRMCCVTLKVCGTS